MKTSVIKFSIGLSLSFYQMQSQNWLTVGNFMSGTEKLGSTNPIALDFYTNNTPKMRLAVNGNLGIGGNPNNRLDVFGGDIVEISL